MEVKPRRLVLTVSRQRLKSVLRSWIKSGSPKIIISWIKRLKMKRKSKCKKMRNTAATPYETPHPR